MDYLVTLAAIAVILFVTWFWPILAALVLLAFMLSLWLCRGATRRWRRSRDRDWW